MIKRLHAPRFGRLRTLALSGIVLGALVAASAATATSADAATMSTRHADACGEIGPVFFPQGDGALMIEPSSGLHVIVIPWLIASYPTPVGYVDAWDAFTGQHYRSLLQSPLNTLYPVQISSFAVALGYDFSTRQYTPELIYNSCVWNATFDRIS
jgi:hypothetical protein